MAWLVCIPCSVISFPELIILTVVALIFLSSSFDYNYVEKQSMAWEEYREKYQLLKLQEHIGKSTGRRNITPISLKTVLNTYTLQSLNRLSKTSSIPQSFICSSRDKGVANPQFADLFPYLIKLQVFCLSAVHYFNDNYAEKRPTAKN